VDGAALACHEFSLQFHLILKKLTHFADCMEAGKANSEHIYINFNVWDASAAKAIDLLEEFEESDLVDMVRTVLFSQVRSPLLILFFRCMLSKL